MKLNGNLTLNSNATGEIQNVFIERLAAAPTFDAQHKGRLYFNTTTSLFYYNDGSAYVPFATGGNAALLQAEVDNIEAALGAALNGDGTFNGAALAGAAYISGATSITGALTALDASINANITIAELDDVTLGALSDKNVLYFDNVGSVWRNAGAGSTSGVQGYDSGLDSLAALTGPGFVTVDATGNVMSARSISQPAAGVTVSNGDGSGNVSIGLANDLAAVEGLSSNGIAVRTAADTWTTRSVTGGLTGTVIVGNGDGIAGDVALDMQTLTIPTNAGSFSKFAYDTYGRITSIQAVTETDIAGLVDTRYINVTGDAMAGSLNMAGNTISNLASPVAGTDAVNKNFVESYVNGMSWKQAVKAATLANVNLASPGAAIDGVTLTTGTRVLVKNQTDAKENGIYTYDGAALVRATDADAGAELEGAAVFVTEGTQSDTGWTQNTDTVTLGTSNVVFAQFTGSGTYTAGSGMSLTGNTFAVNLGAGIAELPSDEVGIDLYNVGANPLILTTDGSTRTTATNGALDLKLDAATLTKGANGLKVSAGGITEVELNSSALAANGGLTGGSGTTVAVNADGSTIDISANVVAVKDSGISTVKIADGAVTNVKLANSKVTLTGDSGAGTDLTLGVTVTVDGQNGINVNTAAGAVAVTLTAGLDNLSDVVITGTPALGETLTVGASGFANRKIYHHYEGTANTSHSVVHSIGQQFCNVTVADSSGEVVIPQSITFVDVNTLTVTFTSAIACHVIVMGVNTTN